MLEQEFEPEDLTIPRWGRIYLRGNTVSIVTCGPSDGQPVILIHGFPTSAEIWRPFQAKLARQGYRTFSIDLPGFGKTQCKTPGMAQWDTAIDFISQFVRSDSSLKNIWWFGHQMGALMALSCAEKFKKISERCTIIQPLFRKSQLWPEPELKEFALSMKLGIYPKAAKSGLLERRLLSQRMSGMMDSMTNVDRYLHRRLLCNEKILDAERQLDFVDFFKSLPNNFVTETFERLLNLQMPKQVILDVMPEVPPLEKAKLIIQKVKDRKGQHETQYFSWLNRIAKDKNIELISLKSDSPYLPLFIPISSAEAALLWGKEGMHEQLIAEFQESHKRPEPPPEIELPEIRIDPALSLPPDGKPEHVQPKAPAKRPAARKRTRSK